MNERGERPIVSDTEPVSGFSLVCTHTLSFYLSLSLSSVFISTRDVMRFFSFPNKRVTKHGDNKENINRTGIRKVVGIIESVKYVGIVAFSR